MLYHGSCHCQAVTYEIEADLQQVIACNCSHCSRKGYLLAFAPRDALRVKSGERDLSTYMFNKHVIRHYFCSTCGCAPFGEGTNPATSEPMAAINVRCLEGIEPAELKTMPFDGRSV